MIDNISAFQSTEYDRKILQTLPYYEEYFHQIIELVKTVFSRPVSWLDIGCGTGKMGSVAFEKVQIERFVFLDSAEAMTAMAKDRFRYPNAEFSVCDVREMSYVNEFDVITAIQVFHFLQGKERKAALERSCTALKKGAIFISFENIAPFTETGVKVCLEKWVRFQEGQGKSPEESRQQIERYGKDYYPITVEEHLNLMRESGFRVVELLWFSNMQAGFWGMK